MKLSDWSTPGEKPPCVGLWETDYINDSSPTYQYWNGSHFMCADYSPQLAFKFKHLKSFCDQSTIRFRGLAGRNHNV